MNINPKGPEKAKEEDKVIRGGSLSDSDFVCSVTRYSFTFFDNLPYAGFRIVMMKTNARKS